MKYSKFFLIPCFLLIMFLSSCSKKEQEQDMSSQLTPTLPNFAPSSIDALTLFPPVTIKIPTISPPTPLPNNPLTQILMPPIVTPTNIVSPTTEPTPKPNITAGTPPTPTAKLHETVPPSSETKTDYYTKAWLPSVELSPKNFPDETFRTLISKVVDKDHDGMLTLAERETLVYLRDTFYDEYMNVYEPDNVAEDFLMTQLLPKVVDFTGIEYFPQLKTFYMKRRGDKYQLIPSINFMGLPNLETIVLQTYHTVPESTYYFNFEHLPHLISVQMEINNLDSVSHISFNDTKELKEFHIAGNIASLNGLEQASASLQKMILKFDKIGDFSLLSRNSSYFTFDLTNFTKLDELHIFMQESAKTYQFCNGAALEILGVHVPDSTVVFCNMPKLQDTRVFRATAVKSENCPALEMLKLAMSNPLECLDLSSFSALKVLEIAWHTMEVKSLILPNDSVDIVVSNGKTETTITYQEQQVLQKMQQGFQEAFSKPVTLTNSAIDYEKIPDESFTSGVFEFICSPNHGYKIDLDGDGIDEELYTDSQDFYINGIGLNLSRNNYNGSDNPWDKFWIFVSDRDIKTRKLIINTAPIAHYYYSLHPNSSVPEYYWGGGDPMDWGTKANLQPFVSDSYIGQFFLSYNGNIHLQGYAESDASWHNEASDFYPFVEAKYGLEEISFPNMKGRWIRIYGTDEIPSLYFKNIDEYP